MYYQNSFGGSYSSNSVTKYYSSDSSAGYNKLTNSSGWRDYSTGRVESFAGKNQNKGGICNICTDCGHC